MTTFDHDEDPRDDRVGREHDPAPGQRALDAALHVANGARRRARGCARVVRAAQADGGERDAVCADRPTALGARQTGLPVGMAVAGRHLAVSVPGSHASPCRIHSGRGGLRAARNRRRRPARDLDDRAGARGRLPARAVLRGDRGGARGCARRRRARSSAASATRSRIEGFDVGASPREFVEPRRRHADPVDDERDADDPDRRRALRRGRARVAAEPRRGRRGRARAWRRHGGLLRRVQRRVRARRRLLRRAGSWRCSARSGPMRRSRRSSGRRRSRTRTRRCSHARTGRPGSRRTSSSARARACCRSCRGSRG